MKRLGVAVVVMLFAAGCGSQPSTAAPAPQAKPKVATPSASFSPSTTPSATQAAIEFSVDGAGPYLLGAKLSELQAATSVVEVSTGGATCPGNTTARGTGTWSDIYLSFRKDGVLYLVVNRSISVPTPSGAWLGTSLADLKKIYVNVTGQELTKGGHVAFLVTTLSAQGILFDLDENKKVISMAAGDSGFLRTSFQGGTNYC